jgi:integrase
MARTRHHQAGYVFKKGSNWYLRYRETVQLEGGSIQRIQKCRRLAKVTGQYRTKRAAEQLAEEIIRPLNDGVIRPESTMSLNHFIEVSYLPYVAEQKRRSTYSGYKNIWLAILPERTATVVATAAFTGARKGELRGLMWEDYDGSEIRVMKSVWRSHVDEPKRPKSKAAIRSSLR